MIVESFRGRQIVIGAIAKVYRNISRPDGPWYSIVQRGRVVAHAREVVLADGRCVVREAGRQRVIATGVKNVHAFVVGTLTAEFPRGPFAAARYNPKRAPTFEVAIGDAWAPLHRAAFVVLRPSGLWVTGAAQPAASPGTAPRPQKAAAKRSP